MDLNVFIHLPKFLLNLVDLGVDQSRHKMESDYIKLWNKGFLSLSILFFLISVCDFFFISSVISYSFFLMAVVFFYMLFTDLRFNKLAQTFAYLFLSFVFFYTSSHTGLKAGIYLFYIPLALFLPVFFNLKKDRQSVVLICGFIFLELFLDFMTNKSKHPMERSLFIESSIGSSILVFWVVYFVLNKQMLQIKHYKAKAITKVGEVEVDIEKLSEVVDLAKKADKLFLAKFKSLYPCFCERLIEIQPTLVVTELEFCAYLRLNFSTKEIARYTNNSIRSVEGRKYRIRKKYNISEKVDIYIWVASL